MSDDRSSGEAAEPGSTNPGRDARGRWGKGNPGRPKGLRFRATLAAEALLDGRLEGLTEKCIAAAEAGDMIAMRLCMERSLPVRKTRPVQFAMPPLKSAEDASAAMAAIVEAVSSGELSPDEGEVLTRLVEGFIKTHELTDLERRVRAIEAAAASSK